MSNIQYKIKIPHMGGFWLQCLLTTMCGRVTCVVSGAIVQKRAATIIVITYGTV